MMEVKQGLFEQELPYCDARSLYRKLRGLPLPVLLASGSDNGQAGRYDILCADPLRVLRSKGGRLTLSHAGGREEVLAGSPLAALKRAFGRPLGDSPLAPEVPFAGGAIGWFAYDLLHQRYRIPARVDDDIALPALLAGIYPWAVVLDHHKRRCRFYAQPDCEPERRERALALLCGSAETADRHFRLRGRFRSNFSREEYLRACRRVIDYIHAGDCYQVNLAQRFSAPCEGDPFAAFDRLHDLANAPFSAFMEAPEGAVLSFSPERFLRVRDGLVTTQPIKGTRPRHKDPARDQALLRDLLASPKDRAENLMIVDLLRNDLGRVCRTGSVRVPALFEAHSFRNVHHLISTVEGRLDQPARVLDLLEACFPGGSITGTPKIRAMEIIEELESRRRSVYCGSIAWIGYDGAMDSSICIRTLVQSEDRIHCWGGGGVVADSVPEQEYQETLDKISLFIDGLQGPE